VRLSEMRERFCALTTRDGATISYRIVKGETPRRAMVLIHGMASNMTRWSEFVEQTGLRDSWDLLRLDLRGNGRSISRGRITMRRAYYILKTLSGGTFWL
jgi:pimeloyl-ACP methyl ester carboxylesterase